MALHELLNDLNWSRNLKNIIILLFIDFKKAFDTVDPFILLEKLKHYCFSSDAINLMINYFFNRKQLVKLGDVKSSLLQISLGVPQGSILGPLLFKIFINDIVFFIKLLAKLFADDTTLYNNYDPKTFSIQLAIEDFKKSLGPLLEWCEFNRLDINWDKTHFMFISYRKQVFPEFIEVLGNRILVVDEFKLLGITLDNTLNFCKHVSNTLKAINSKLFSIKRLFFLPLAVKIQFFKTFILPYFDYCFSLCIYFPKYVLQNLQNHYYFCLFKLFEFDFKNLNYSEINNFLKNYKLFSFECGVFYRLSLFIGKIINSIYAPPNLRSLLKRSENSRSLRNSNQFIVKRTKNHYGEATFSYFFSKFLNNVFKDSLNNLGRLSSKKYLNDNFDRLFNIFLTNFDKFNLEYRVNTSLR